MLYEWIIYFGWKQPNPSYVYLTTWCLKFMFGTINFVNFISHHVHEMLLIHFFSFFRLNGFVFWNFAVDLLPRHSTTDVHKRKSSIFHVLVWRKIGGIFASKIKWWNFKTISCTGINAREWDHFATK